jgi:hypothetical protein
MEAESGSWKTRLVGPGNFVHEQTTDCAPYEKMELDKSVGGRWPMRISSCEKGHNTSCKAFIL